MSCDMLCSQKLKLLLAMKLITSTQAKYLACSKIDCHVSDLDSMVPFHVRRFSKP